MSCDREYCSGGWVWNEGTCGYDACPCNPPLHTKKPVDPDAGAKAAARAYYQNGSAWDTLAEGRRDSFRRVAEAVRRADREGR